MVSIALTSSPSLPVPSLQPDFSGSRQHKVLVMVAIYEHTSTVRRDRGRSHSVQASYTQSEHARVTWRSIAIADVTVTRRPQWRIPRIDGQVCRPVTGRGVVSEPNTSRQVLGGLLPARGAAWSALRNRYRLCQLTLKIAF